MKEWLVTLNRTVHYSTLVCVEAENPSEAKLRALGLDMYSEEFELNDGLDVVETFVSHVEPNIL
jgi:hypothetical protein